MQIDAGKLYMKIHRLKHLDSTFETDTSNQYIFSNHY